MFTATTAAKTQVGKLIKTARTKAGLTQAALATKLGYASPQILSNWERAESLPPMSQIPKIAKHTKTHINEFKNILIKDFTKSLNTLN